MANIKPIRMLSATLFGVRVDCVKVEDVLNFIIYSIRMSSKAFISYVNVHAINIARRDEKFREIVNRSSLVFCDGFGVKWGARMLGQPIGERMTPPDWIDLLCERLNKDGFSMFLLGDEPGVAESCGNTLLARHPGLRFVGSHHGFFKKTGVENDHIIDKINDCNPDIVLVGFGMPIQEYWVDENIRRINAKVILSVGALFRWISGIDRRAPKWASDIGLEWLFRFLKSPIKHFDRYFIGNLSFGFKVLWHAIWRI